MASSNSVEVHATSKRIALCGCSVYFRDWSIRLPSLHSILLRSATKRAALLYRQPFNETPPSRNRVTLLHLRSQRAASLLSHDSTASCLRSVLSSRRRKNHEQCLPLPSQYHCIRAW